jgi:MOSC domain-containing protein YiiM
MKNRLRSCSEGRVTLDAMAEQPHVVAVNVGRPAPLGLGDRVVASGIVKHATAGPVAIGALGVEGDEQADRVHHGGPYKAVYAYAREDVAWWETEIRRPIEPASFGENLTLAGVDVTGARIGERWLVGTVLLEVSEPRIPCWKLGRRMEDPRFPKRFAAAGRPGAYLRIVTPGELGAGDAVEVVASPEHEVSVGLVSHAYLRDHSLAGRLLEIDGVSQGWRAWAEERLAKLG